MATVKLLANVSGNTIPLTGLKQFVIAGVKGAKAIRLEFSGGSSANLLDILTCTETSAADGSKAPQPSANNALVSAESLARIDGAEGAGFTPIFLPSANPAGTVCTPYAVVSASVATADVTGVKFKAWGIFDTPAMQDDAY